MLRAGQSFDAERVMVVVVVDGKAHGWDVAPAKASWDFTGIANGRSTVHIDIDGPMRRRTRNLEELELEAGTWELEGDA